MGFDQISLKGRALRLLSGREHSRAELLRKLRPHETEPGELAKALDELEAKGFISEQRVIESVVHRRSVKLGASRVRQELQAKGLDPQAVAEAVGTHPRQLHREFVANTQEPPANYWRKLRLDHARRLLVNTSQNITTIALACGFSDASHFILWFRKQYGETPYSFRKRRHEVERFDWHGDKVGLDPEL